MRNWLVRVGFAKALISAVVLAILISLMMTTLVVNLTGEGITLTAVLAAVVIPVLTAGLFGTIILRLVYELEEAEQRFRELATLDDLTGIKNRRYFLEIAERDLAIAKRYGVEFSILLIDLDEFKRVNDSYGHMVGDNFLKAVAQACNNELRKTDLLARLGGDEFIVLIPQSNYVDTDHYMERLKQKISEIQIVGDNLGIHITASIGAARYTGAIDSIDKLMSLADRAMYDSKNERNGNPG